MLISNGNDFFSPHTYIKDFMDDVVRFQNEIEEKKCQKFISACASRLHKMLSMEKNRGAGRLIIELDRDVPDDAKLEISEKNLDSLTSMMKEAGDTLDLDRTARTVFMKAHQAGIRIRFIYGKTSFTCQWSTDWFSMCFSYSNAIDAIAFDYCTREIVRLILSEAFKTIDSIDRLSVCWTDYYVGHARYLLAPLARGWFESASHIELDLDSPMTGTALEFCTWISSLMKATGVEPGSVTTEYTQHQSSDKK